MIWHLQLFPQVEAGRNNLSLVSVLSEGYCWRALPWRAQNGPGYGHCIQNCRETKENLLLWAGTQLMFLTAAATGLCLDLCWNSAGNSGMFCYCSEGLTQSQGLFCLSPQQGRG